MSGWMNQETGDKGQAIVAAELTRAGFLVGDLAPDPGEDLWAEVDGRRAAATGDFPLRALFQVKAKAGAVEEFVLDVEIDHLKRWAAQPLPVFVVGVSVPTNHLFMKSVDQIISGDLAGRNLFDLQNQTNKHVIKILPGPRLPLSGKLLRVAGKPGPLGGSSGRTERKTVPNILDRGAMVKMTDRQSMETPRGTSV